MSTLGEVDAVVLSHLHGDHFGGLPFLVLDGQFTRRTRPLVVLGPTGTAGRLRAAMETFYAGSTAAQRRYVLQFVELDGGGGGFEVGPLTVRSWEVDHASGAPALALQAHLGGGDVRLLRRHGVDRRPARGSCGHRHVRLRGIHLGEAGARSPRPRRPARTCSRHGRRPADPDPSGTNHARTARQHRVRRRGRRARPPHLTAAQRPGGDCRGERSGTPYNCRNSLNIGILSRLGGGSSCGQSLSSTGCAGPTKRRCGDSQLLSAPPVSRRRRSRTRAAVRTGMACRSRRTSSSPRHWTRPRS